MFEYIIVFDFTNEIDQKNWKTWSRPEYWIKKNSFINNLYQHEETMEQFN